MNKILIAAALSGFLSIPVQATPLIPAALAGQMAVQSDDFIQVKQKGKARPYGWSKSRKVGWRGRGMPPGQAKKLR
jgi:hypothetical protein